MVKLIIRGLSSIDVPSVDYNGMAYNLNMIGENKYESEKLCLVDTATKVTVRINDKPINTFNIKVSTGASEEDDLFDF